MNNYDRFAKVRKAHQRQVRNKVLAVIFGVMFVSGMFVNVVHLLSIASSTNMSFFDYLSVSDFGWTTLMWNNNPALVVVSLVLFIIGFIGMASRMR